MGAMAEAPSGRGGTSEIAQNWPAWNSQRHGRAPLPDIRGSPDRSRVRIEAANVLRDRALEQLDVLRQTDTPGIRVLRDELEADLSPTT
jgi:hypothetical protein